MRIQEAVVNTLQVEDLLALPRVIAILKAFYTAVCLQKLRQFPSSCVSFRQVASVSVNKLQ